MQKNTQDQHGSTSGGTLSLRKSGISAIVHALSLAQRSFVPQGSLFGGISVIVPESSPVYRATLRVGVRCCLEHNRCSGSCKLLKVFCFSPCPLRSLIRLICFLQPLRLSSHLLKGSHFLRLKPSTTY